MYSILNCLSVSNHIGLIVWPFNIGKPPAQYCVSMQCLILKVSNSTFIYFPTHHPHIFSSRCWTYWVLLFLFWRILCVLLVLVACVTISFTCSSGKHTHKRLSMGQFCSSLDDLIHSCPFLESFKPFSWMLRKSPIFVEQSFCSPCQKLPKTIAFSSTFPRPRPPGSHMLQAPVAIDIHGTSMNIWVC